MLLRLQGSFRLIHDIRHKLVLRNQLNHDVISKRWSGHNAMPIEPSNYGWKHFKNTLHFYTLLASIPVIVISTIINIRANPELTEIPEGYEPRHWEYYKHPITRFLARYCFKPEELEQELYLASVECDSENMILRKIQDRVEKVMIFYNDHRSMYFRPSFAEYFRIGRDDNLYGHHMSQSLEGQYIDYAYDPTINPVPTEGYPPVQD